MQKTVLKQNSNEELLTSHEATPRNGLNAGAEDVAVRTPYRPSVRNRGMNCHLCRKQRSSSRWSGSHVGQSAQKKEVIVIGAGPYGLSATAYLLAAGVEPMSLGSHGILEAEYAQGHVPAFAGGSIQHLRSTKTLVHRKLSESSRPQISDRCHRGFRLLRRRFQKQVARTGPTSGPKCFEEW